MGFRSYLICITLLCAIWPARADHPCIPKNFGSDSIVCVCNSTYCDTIDKIVPLVSGKYLQYTSNQAGLRFEKTTGSFKKTKKSPHSGLLIDVITSTTYQTVMGFGAAFTDAAGINIKSLSPGAQENLIRSYFSTEGIEYNFGRVPIAGTDFSTYPYTYDDVAYDSRLKMFNLTPEDFEYKIPIIHRAIEMSEKEIYLVGAAWTAPPWMKTNNDYSGVGFLKDEYYEPWAQYHIKFLDAYKKEGLEFWSISTGNEPTKGNSPQDVLNSLGWHPNTQIKWLRENLGPAMRNSQHNKTKILALDDRRLALPWWFDDLKTDSVASGFVDGIGMHWYKDNEFPPSLLDGIHDRFPDKFILGTEAAAGTNLSIPEKVILGSWPRGELYMKDIIQNLNHWYVGWIDWNMALDRAGGPNWVKNMLDAAIIVNSDADEFYKQPMYYALGHFSKFLPEGSVRIQLKAKLSNAIDSIAFKTPEDVIVIVLSNSDEKDTPVTIRDECRGVVNIVLSAHSFQTIMYK